MARLEWAAPTRNREPILAVPREVLPATGTALEIASRTGQHAMFFAAAVPGSTWQPSDADPVMLGSIEAWPAEGPGNVLPGAPLAVHALPWALRGDAVVCSNLVHISSWETTLALLEGAAGT